MQKHSPLWNQRLLNALALLIGGLGFMFPWAWRNYQAFQTPMLTTTHGGYTLYLANNRHFYRYLREDESGLPWEPRTQTEWTSGQLRYRQSFREERRIALWYGPNAPFSPNGADNERDIDKYQMRMALFAMQDDPAGLALAALYRVRQLWTPLPYKLTADESVSRSLLRYLTAVWYCVLYALALAGMFHLRWDLLRSPWVFGMALCLIFTAVHTLYWCNLRMRAPVMPIVAVIASAGALMVARRVSEGGAGTRSGLQRQLP